ncbi:MAG: glycosyltransferase 87 family protein [Lachnospiraceae bacterium]|nr:glycosyltransferase 87 family protein [Lachnospiraceae bacterium]
MENKGKKRTNIALLFAAALSVFSAFSFVYNDMKIQTAWARIFLDGVESGTIRRYAELVEQGFPACPNNYSLFYNICMALWFAPLRIAERLSGGVIAEFVWFAWFKLLILLCFALCTLLIAKILKKLGKDEESIGNLLFLFLVSPVTQYAGIAIGQVDCFSLVLMLAAVHALLDERYGRMCFLVSLSLMFKPFVLFAFLPIFFLRFYREPVKMFRYGAVTLSMPALMQLLGRTYFIDYEQKRSFYDSLFHFPDRILGGSIYETAPFVTLFCILLYFCARKCSENKCTRKDDLLFPFCGILLFLLFSEWSAHWIVYLSFFLLFCALLAKRKQDVLLLYLVLGIFYPLYVVSKWPAELDMGMLGGALLTQLSGIRYDGHELGWFVGNHLIDVKYAVIICRSVITAALLLLSLPVLRLFKGKGEEAFGIDGKEGAVSDGKKKNGSNRSAEFRLEKKEEKLLLYAQCIPWLLFLGAVWILAMKG